MVQWEENILLNELGHSNNGGDTSISFKENQTWDIKYDTKGEEEGYYTTFFFAQHGYSLSKGNVISFHIEAKSVVRMNINFALEEGTKPYLLDDDAVVFTRNDNESKYDFVPVDYGTFSLPKGFSGTVYIPIQKLKKALQVTNLGFIIVQKNNQITNMSFSNLTVSNGYELDNEVFHEQFEIIGPQEMEIPLSGEYHYQYSVQMKDELKKVPKCLFYLEEDEKDLKIDKTGKVILTNQTKAREISFVIELNGILRYHYKAVIKNSWMLSEKDPVVYDLIVPKKSEVARIKYSDKNFDDIIQISFGIATSFFMAFYIVMVKGKN